MLGEIVVDTERVLAVGHEVLAHRAAGVWREVLQRRRLGGRGVDDDGVVHRAVLLERAHDLRDGRLLLTDRDVHADDVLALLIDDRVDGDRGLAGLTIADDQLALSAADGNHRVDRFESGLQRLLDRLAVDDARRETLDRVALVRVDRTLAVNRHAERVHDAADHRLSDRDRHDDAGALDLVALFDRGGVAQENDADVVLLEVERESGDIVRERDELARHDALESVDARDSVTNRSHGSDLGYIDAAADARQLLPDNLCDFFCFQIDSHMVSVNWP